MALPSTLNRKRGLFGASVPNMIDEARPPLDPGYAAPPEPQKPKFFGEGGVGRAIAGNIGDFLLQYSGMQPIYAPIMQQRQAAQAAERERQQGLADWVAKQEYEAAHRPPPNNDTINDFNWYKSLSPEDRAIYREMKPEYRQGADGRFYRIDIAPQGPPPQITEDDWAKGTPVGGGTSGTPAGGRF